MSSTVSLDTSLVVVSSSSTSTLDSSALDSRSNSINNLEHSDNLSSSNDIDKDSNNDNTNREKPDPQTLVQIEKNLLSLFGFTKRPKAIDRSKIVIPEAMKQLYAQIMGHELDSSINLPKAGLHTKNANTVRSFTHEGEYRH